MNCYMLPTMLHIQPITKYFAMIVHMLDSFFKSLAIDLSLSFIQFKAFYECQSIFYVLCLNLFIVSGIKLSPNIRYM